MAQVQQQQEKYHLLSVLCNPSPNNMIKPSSNTWLSGLDHLPGLFYMYINYHKGLLNPEIIFAVIFCTLSGMNKPYVTNTLSCVSLLECLLLNVKKCAHALYSIISSYTVKRVCFMEHKEEIGKRNAVHISPIYHIPLIHTSLKITTWVWTLLPHEINDPLFHAIPISLKTVRETDISNVSVLVLYVHYRTSIYILVCHFSFGD